MCGIFALLNNKYCPIEKIKKEFMKSQSRGPEYSDLVDIKIIQSYIGFHRLSINGFNDKKANQPFCINNIYLICNGEIYNHKELTDILNITPTSRSDCEIIIYLYERYGIEQTLQMLDGVFAFVLIDTEKKHIFVARDTYGVRPLFINTFKTFTGGGKQDYTSYAFASEVKCLLKIW